MTNDQLLTMILSIGLPMLAGFGFMIFKMFSMQKDLSEDIKNVEIKLTQEIRSLDRRISHIEGYLMGRDAKTGTH